MRENYDSVLYCDGMVDALDRLQAIAQTELLAGDSPDPAAISELRKTFENMAHDQINNSSLPGERAMSDAILAAGAAYLQRLVDLTAAPQPGRLALYQTRLFPQYQSTRSQLEQVSRMNLVNLATVNGQVRAALLDIRNTAIAIMVSGVFLAVLIVYLSARGIIKPLHQLTASVRQVEAGNLDAVVETHEDDEIGQLTLAFNAMAGKLREFRRRDLERLARTQLTTQTAIDSLPDAVAVLDPSGLIEIANLTAQRHFGLIPNTNIAKVRPDWAAAYFQPVIQTRQPVLPDGYKSAVQLFDDSGERFLLPRAVPMLDADGTLLGVTFLLVEVTHLHRADEFKSGLLATVSHELKTPLTSVRMAVRLLLDSRLGSLNESQQKLLAAARIDSERLVRTLDDILTINRVEAGRARLHLAPVTAREIIERSIAGVESIAHERHTTFTTDCPAEISLNADLTLVSCALSNFLSNAVKYSPPNSVVTIAAQRSDGILELSVTDTGPGIPAEFQDRIFEKFFRIPTNGGPSGVGLGLSIAREIVQLHEGTVHLKSSQRGSRFSLRLPLDR